MNLDSQSAAEAEVGLASMARVRRCGLVFMIVASSTEKTREQPTTRRPKSCSICA